MERIKALLRRLTPVVAYAIAGSFIALALAAHVNVSVGPFDATMSARPSLHGDTLVRLGPLGTVRFDTHDAPVRLETRIDELRLEEAEAIANDPSTLAAIEDDLAVDARSAVWALLWRSILVAVAGGAIGALVQSRGIRPLIVGLVAGAMIAGSISTLAVVTWRAEAIAEPRYTGLLTVAPTAVGDAQDLADRYGEYRAQLAKLVGNTVTIYRAAEGVPGSDPQDSSIRILHVSDVHLNPQGFDLTRELVEEFKVKAVIDSGDTTDWGTEPESQLVARIGELSVPYVWVRGNHDSRETQNAIAAQRNAIVLDGTSREVAGLTMFGVGDPRYTPDKSRPTGKEVEKDEAASFAPKLAQMLRGSDVDVDVVIVHDARIASRVGKLTPLVLAGHTHHPRRSSIGDATLLVQGSTGGAGLRGLEGKSPEPLTASILYFHPETRRLIAYDQVSVRGLGQTGAQIERHVITPPPGEASKSG